KLTKRRHPIPSGRKFMFTLGEGRRTDSSASLRLLLLGRRPTRSAQQEDLPGAELAPRVDLLLIRRLDRDEPRVGAEDLARIHDPRRLPHPADALREHRPLGIPLRALSQNLEAARVHVVADDARGMETPHAAWIFLDP